MAHLLAEIEQMRMMREMEEAQHQANLLRTDTHSAFGSSPQTIAKLQGMESFNQSILGYRKRKNEEILFLQSQENADNARKAILRDEIHNRAVKAKTLAIKVSDKHFKEREEAYSNTFPLIVAGALLGTYLFRK